MRHHHGKHHEEEELRRVEVEAMGGEEKEPEAIEEITPDKLASDIAEMQEELEKLKADAEESRDRYLRTLADFDNFRKRQRDENVRQANLIREEMILKVLPIAENFERAMQAADAQHSYESLIEGVQLTLRQLHEMLAKEGVEQIDSIGQEFNPEFHEAMMRVETDEYPENTIIDEFEKGYTLNGKVLRPAKVRVATSE